MRGGAVFSGEEDSDAAVVPDAGDDVGAGTADERRRQWMDLLEGYEQFAQFDRAELTLIEPLRAFRMLHYAAWLARRWADPAFPAAFPWFGTPAYWAEQTQLLRQQIDLMQGGAHPTDTDELDW